MLNFEWLFFVSVDFAVFFLVFSYCSASVRNLLWVGAEKLILLLLFSQGVTQELWQKMHTSQGEFSQEQKEHQDLLYFV